MSEMLIASNNDYRPERNVEGYFDQEIWLEALKRLDVYFLQFGVQDAEKRNDLAAEVLSRVKSCGSPPTISMIMLTVDQMLDESPEHFHGAGMSRRLELVIASSGNHETESSRDLPAGFDEKTVFRCLPEREAPQLMLTQSISFPMERTWRAVSFKLKQLRRRASRSGQVRIGKQTEPAS